MLVLLCQSCQEKNDDPSPSVKPIDQVVDGPYKVTYNVSLSGDSIFKDKPVLTYKKSDGTSVIDTVSVEKIMITDSSFVDGDTLSLKLTLNTQNKFIASIRYLVERDGIIAISSIDKAPSPKEPTTFNLTTECIIPCKNN